MLPNGNHGRPPSETDDEHIGGAWTTAHGTADCPAGQLLQSPARFAFHKPHQCHGIRRKCGPPITAAKTACFTCTLRRQHLQFPCPVPLQPRRKADLAKTGIALLKLFGRRPVRSLMMSVMLGLLITVISGCHCCSCSESYNAAIDGVSDHLRSGPKFDRLYCEELDPSRYCLTGPARRVDCPAAIPRHRPR